MSEFNATHKTSTVCSLREDFKVFVLGNSYANPTGEKKVGSNIWSIPAQKSYCGFDITVQLTAEEIVRGDFLIVEQIGVISNDPSQIEHCTNTLFSCSTMYEALKHINAYNLRMGERGYTNSTMGSVHNFLPNFNGVTKDFSDKNSFLKFLYPKVESQDYAVGRQDVFELTENYEDNMASVRMHQIVRPELRLV